MNFFLRGFSRSCINTTFYWPEFSCLLDCGPFSSLYGLEAEHIFISHSHTDHINGLINLLYLKFCKNHFYKITIYAPEETCIYINKLLEFNKKNGDIHILPDVEIIPFTHETIHIKNNIYCHPVKTFHRCESTGFMFTAGKDIILIYTSDTTSEILNNPDLYKTRYLLIESTYLEEEYIERARERGHIALPELNYFSEKFKGEKIYLTHFSESYKINEIYNATGKMKFNFLFEPVGLKLEEPGF